MLKRLISFAVDAPWMTTAAALLIAAFGLSAIQETPVDAFPDISENQAIVLTEWMGRSPQDVEDQITYPLSSELKAISGVKEVRGMSGFGFSQIYVVFEDDIDFYWARSRVLERLASIQGSLPPGVTPQLGPEATALGQIFWYTLDAPGYDLATLRSLQDFYVKLALQSVDGVAEVASVGGFVRQYQIDVDPNRLKAYEVSIAQLRQAVLQGNLDVGAKTIEHNGLESVIRGVGFVKSIEDIEDIVVSAREGAPIYVRNLAKVQLGPDFRRGALADATGERVGGVVTMRYGANPQEVIEGVKTRIAEIEGGLPEGVKIVPFYDRSQLITETTATLTLSLSQELLITIVVVVFFLLHLRTSLIIATTLPLAVAIAFIAMRLLGLGADIMSLSGIAIAIGTVVDMGIIMSENVFDSLTKLPAGHTLKERLRAIKEAAAEIAPAISTAVATTVISFLPVFFLTGQAGKLFRPLAWTKTFTMVASVLLAITLVPALCRLFLKDARQLHHSLRFAASAAFFILGALLGARLGSSGLLGHLQPWIGALLGGGILALISWKVSGERLQAIEDNPISRGILRVYQPVLRWVLEHPKRFVLAPLSVLFLGSLVLFGAKPTYEPPMRALGIDTQSLRPTRWLATAFPGIGSEFMPPLDEGSYLAMPSILSQGSLNQTMAVMQRMNAEIASIPEVDQVVGKAGRADTALDPAPVGMMETVVNLKPQSQWRPGMTRDKILQELKEKSRIIGTTPSWLQPIETRIVMLQSGIRATMALRLRGAPRAPDGTPYSGDQALRAMEQAVIAMEEVVRKVDGAANVTALRLGGKPYLEFVVDRQAAARYGVKIRDVQRVIETAIGGVNLDWSLEGRERYPIRIQYARELRDELEELQKVLVPTPSGAKIPLASLTQVQQKLGPAAIRTENGQLTAYLMFNAIDRDESAVINDALAAVQQWREEVKQDSGEDPIPQGLTLSPTGRYKNKIEADQRLMLIIPIVLLINFFLIYLQFRSLSLTAIIYTAIPVAFAGGFIMIGLYPELLDLLHWLGLRDQPSPGPVYLTTAVWVGFIALFGVAVDDGVVMGTYIKQVFAKREITNREQLREAIIHAGSRRIRPMLMTSTTTLCALLPILWSQGRGSDLMQPMALPLVGGMLFAFITVFVVPLMVSVTMAHRLKKQERVQL